MDDNGFLEYINGDVVKLTKYDAENLVQWKKHVTKVRRIVLEGVHDHIVSNIHGKETHFTMWKALTKLFKNSIDHRKLALKEKL